MKHKCCTTTSTPGTSVSINVNVSQIIMYLCLASVPIIGIIFGTNCYLKMIDKK